MFGCHFCHFAILPRLTYKIEPFLMRDLFPERQFHRPTGNIQIASWNFVTIQFIFIIGSIEVPQQTVKHETVLITQTFF